MTSLFSDRWAVKTPSVLTSLDEPQIKVWCRLPPGGVLIPIALHCGSFNFNMAVKAAEFGRFWLRPFLFLFTMGKCNLIYSECVKVFFVRICRVFYVFLYVNWDRISRRSNLMYVVVWSLSKIWMAALILLQQLWPNALKRSPTVHVFLAF